MGRTRAGARAGARARNVTMTSLEYQLLQGVMPSTAGMVTTLHCVSATFYRILFFIS